MTESVYKTIQYKSKENKFYIKLKEKIKPGCPIKFIHTIHTQKKKKPFVVP